MNWIYFYTKWKLFFYRIQIYIHNFPGTVKNQLNFAKMTKNEKNQEFFFIFSPKIENSFIIKLYSFIIEIKVVRNVILNNIDFHDQPSRMHRFPPRSRQHFPDSKNSNIWQIWQIFQIWSEYSYSDYFDPHSVCWISNAVHTVKSICEFRLPNQICIVITHFQSIGHHTESRLDRYIYIYIFMVIKISLFLWKYKHNSANL